LLRHSLFQRGATYTNFLREYADDFALKASAAQA
jgi:hypothetical protein